MLVTTGGDPNHGRETAGERGTASAALTAAARGDQAAFAIFYDATVATVYGLMLRMLPDPAQSAQVAQEVFLQAWRQAARFDATRGTACDWIVTIAHRHAVDLIRAEQSHDPG